MPDGPYRGFAIRLAGYGQRGPGAPGAPGRTWASCGPPGDGPSRARPRPGPGRPVVPPERDCSQAAAVAHPAGTRSRGARYRPRAVLPGRGQAQGQPGRRAASRLLGAAGRPAISRLLAAAGTPGHFPSRHNEAIPGPWSAISSLEKAASGKGARPQRRLANIHRVMTGNPFWRGSARPADDGTSFARRRARWPTPAGRPGAAGPARLRGRRTGIRDNKPPPQTHDEQTGGAG